jgi:hypothetical protein
MMMSFAQQAFMALSLATCLANSPWQFKEPGTAPMRARKAPASDFDPAA